MARKNVAKTQNTDMKGVTGYSTQACSPALAPYWHNVCVARLASPRGMAEVTPGLAAIIEPGEYLCSCGQKRFVAGPSLDDLLETGNLNSEDATIDVWTTDMVLDRLTGDKVRREIRGQIQRLVVSVDGMEWRGEPRDVFFAVTLATKDVERFNITPRVVPENVEQPVSRACEVARAARAKRKHQHGHASGGAVRSTAVMASLGNFI